jgi:hypothetical protein
MGWMKLENGFVSQRASEARNKSLKSIPTWAALLCLRRRAAALPPAAAVLLRWRPEAAELRRFQIFYRLFPNPLLVRIRKIPRKRPRQSGRNRSRITVLSEARAVISEASARIGHALYSL